MSRMWNWIDSKNLSDGAKANLFLFISSLISGAVGFIVWLIVSKYALNSWEWAACFVGYPGIFVGFIGGYIFLCRK